jgi:hypothetical protein
MPKNRKYLTMSRFICDDQVETHNNSLVNLIRGVGERVLFTDKKLTKCQPCVTGTFVRRCSIYSRTLVADIGRQSPVTRQQFVEYYKGRRRTIYQAASDGLALKPIRPRDASVSTFVKAEKCNFSTKFDPAPRVIQPRHPRFNVELGRYLLPLEHKVYDAIDRMFKSPVIMSKYNAFEQARVLKEKWDKFKRPVCIGFDASRFDQHVSPEALRFEHDFYRQIFGQDKFLMMLLGWQIHNRGFARSSDGHFTYSRVGSRMSGDMNTSLGNKFLMCLMAKSYVDKHHFGIEFVNNGDDCLLILERSDARKLVDVPTYFRDFGFKIVTEDPVYEFEHIEFCQCRPVQSNGLYRMVRNVKTCLVKDVTALAVGHDVTQYRSWIADVASCGLSFCADVPVLGAFYRMLQRFGQPGNYNGKDALFSAYRTLSKNAHSDCDTPDSSGRYSFWLQTGIHPDAQEQLERYFDTSVWGGDKRQFISNLHQLLK